MSMVYSQPLEQYPPHLAFTTAPTMTNAHASFPASRLLTYDPTEVAKTDSSNYSTTIQWDFGMNRILNVVSLVGSNAGPRTVWSLQWSTDGTTWNSLLASVPFWPNLSAVPAAPPYTEAADPRQNAIARPSSWFYSAADITARYIKIVVTDPDKAGIGGLSFGRLFVGRAWKPNLTLQYGSSFKFDGIDLVDRTDQGSIVLNPGRQYVSASVKQEFISSNEMYNYVYEFSMWRGSARELMVCLDLETQARLQKNILYCRIADGRTISADQFESWSQTWILESL